jgi:hypothetical protein
MKIEKGNIQYYHNGDILVILSIDDRYVDYLIENNKIRFFTDPHDTIYMLDIPLLKEYSYMSYSTKDEGCIYIYYQKCSNIHNSIKPLDFRVVTHTNTK